MKKVYSFVLFVACLILLTGCEKHEDHYAVALPEQIDKITIAWNDGPLTTFSYTEASKIEILAEYFGSLEADYTKEDPTQRSGGNWIIKVESDSKVVEMQHLGTFFQTADGRWWAISAEQGGEFESILKNNIPDELPKTILFEEWITE